MREPNTSSIVVVIDSALPKPSTTEMCDVALLCADASSAAAARVPGRGAGLGDAHAAIADQLRALLQVRRVEQAGDVDLDEIAVGDIQAAVGEREAAGFGKQVHRVRLRLELAADTLTGGTTAILRDAKTPSICATAMPPDDGGGKPQTRHCL